LIRVRPKYLIMIIGIGTDIVYLPRIRKALEKFGEKFYKKIFTEKELKKYTVEEIGGKFSAKESFVKALGTGFKGISLKDVEVLNDKEGKPYILLNMVIKEKFFKEDLVKIHLSISHQKDYAVSCVILEKI